MDSLLDIDKAKCFKQYNIDEDRFNKDIAIIQEWLKTQQHLPPMDEARIKGILLRCKLSLEKTKIRIDSYFTVKSSFPEIINKMDPTLPFVKTTVTLAPLKKLTDKQERILICKYHPSESFDVFEALISTLFIQELIMKYDYCCGYYAVVDLEGCNWDFFKRFTPVYLKTMNIFTKKAYGMKTNGIYLLNAPSIIEKFLAFAKPFTDKKMFDRTVVCPDLETLHTYLDKSILPKEYGGENNETLEELGEKWRKVMVDHRPYFFEMMKEKVDESKRIGKSEFSMDELHGSFRQLEFD